MMSHAPELSSPHTRLDMADNVPIKGVYYRKYVQEGAYSHLAHHLGAGNWAGESGAMFPIMQYRANYT